MPEYVVRLNSGEVVCVNTQTLEVSEVKKEEVVNPVRKIEMLKEAFAELKKYNLPL